MRYATIKRCLSVMLVLICSFHYSSAEVLISENFDYDAGDVDGQDGGEGWGDTWLVSDAFLDTDFKLEVIEPAAPLVYALPGGGFINGGETALGFVNASEEEVVNNEVQALTRPIDVAVDIDEVYFSYLYQYAGDGTETGGFIDDNDFVVWYFNGAGGPQVGLKGNGGNGSAVDDFVGRVSGAFAPPQQAYAPGIDISEEAGTLNDTWLVVGRMSRGDHSDAEDDYDQFDLWINPGADDVDSPNATAMGAEGDSLATELGSIGLRVFSEEPGDAMTWDALRIGESWEDVVGIFGDQDVTIVNPPDPTCVVPTDGIAGDLDGDGTVAFADFLVLSQNFGGVDVAYSQGDIDCDGTVAFADFLVLSQNFGQSTGGASVVPEPNAMTLCLSIGLLLCVRRRRP